MKKFSITEIVEMAIQAEKLGYEFYTEMSRRFRENGELRKLFELLATHESKHGDRFSELMQKIKDEKSEDWEEVILYIRALIDSEFFLGKDKCLPSLEHVKTAREAIDYALCFERETLLFYYTLRETTTEKEIVDAIIKEEKSHIIWLNNLKKSFT